MKTIWKLKPESENSILIFAIDYSNVKGKPATLLRRLVKIYFKLLDFNVKYSFTFGRNMYYSNIC